MEKLYHKEVYWKKYFDREANKLIEKITNTELSYHIKNERMKNPDKKHPYNLDGLKKSIERIKNNENAYLFEIAENNGIILKAVWRVSYDDKNDISIVIRRDRTRVFIVTAWVNSKEDIHFTLNKNNYCKK